MNKLLMSFAFIIFFGKCEFALADIERVYGGYNYNYDYSNSEYGGVNSEENYAFHMMSVLGVDLFYHGLTNEGLKELKQRLNSESDLPRKSRWNEWGEHENKPWENYQSEFSYLNKDVVNIDPLVSHWIESNNIVLDELAFHSNVDDCYVPWISRGNYQLRFIRNEIEEIVAAIVLRSIYKSEYGDVLGAVKDIFTLQKIGRLLTKCENKSAWFAGSYAIKSSNKAFIYLSKHNYLSAHDLQSVIEEMDSLKDIGGIGVILNVRSRVNKISKIIYLFKSGIYNLSASLASKIVERINADELKFIDDFSIPDLRRRYRKARENYILLSEKWEKVKKKRSERKYIFDEDLFEAYVLSPEINDHVLSLLENTDKSRRGVVFSDFSYLLSPPNVLWSRGKEERLITDIRMTKVIIEIELKRIISGTYPENLEFLVRHNKELVTDLFSDDLYKYEMGEGVSRIYSVGVDQKDDGGDSELDIVIDW
jgi:hypothetical protein